MISCDAFKKWPYYDSDEIDAVMNVLRSGRVNYWTGDECRSFETEYAQDVGTRYAIALANGTVALEAALAALDIGGGDDVVLACRTFIASASCAVMRGAKPIMADIDPVSQNITVDSISKVITPRTKAIITVHLAGWPCDMDPIISFARERGVFVIEDCAQAHGARYKGRKVGSIGDVAAFSFCQDKIITTGGEGGMLTTNSSDIWQKVWSLKDHGKSYDAVYNRKHGDGFRWLHESFGTNWRMTEMQAAIGRIQLGKLEDWLAKRRRNASILTRYFEKKSTLRTTIPPPEIEHAYYKYYVFIRPESLKMDWNRDRIMGEIIANGVPCLSGSCGEIYREKAFENSEFKHMDRLPIAKALGETSLMFTVHPTLTVKDMEYAGEVVTNVLQKASK